MYYVQLTMYILVRSWLSFCLLRIVKLPTQYVSELVLQNCNCATIAHLNPGYKNDSRSTNVSIMLLQYTYLLANHESKCSGTQYFQHALIINNPYCIKKTYVFSCNRVYVPYSKFYLLSPNFAKFARRSDLQIFN